MRLPLLFLALSSLVVLAAPADAAKRHHKSCARKGTHTVKTTKLVRLSTRPNGDGGHDLIGCLRSTDRATILTSSYDDDYVLSGEYDHVRVAGRFVAWQFTATDISCKAACPPDYDETTTSLSVRDLRKKRNVGVSGEIASKGRLVLTKGGAIAWSEDAPLAIKAFDGGGARTLDTGDGIAVGSLKLQGREAIWANGAETRTATLADR
jgi:hypothetical protein